MNYITEFEDSWRKVLNLSDYEISTSEVKKKIEDLKDVYNILQIENRTVFHYSINKSDIGKRLKWALNKYSRDTYSITKSFKDSRIVAKIEKVL